MPARPFVSRALLVFGCALVSACGDDTPTIPFEPIGNDVTLSGVWNVNGDIPSIESCADIDQVRLMVCETSTGGPCVDVGLTYSCDAGAFDTRPAPVLAFGFYFSRWEALDVNGSLLERTAVVPLDATGSHAVVTTPDFVVFNPSGSDVTLSGEWDVAGAIPTVGLCGDIVNVRLLICEGPAGVDCEDLGLLFPCEAGAFDTRPDAVLAAGRYYTRWQALNGAGVVIEQMGTEVLDATSITHAIIATPNFGQFDPSGSAVSLSGEWDVNGAAPTTFSCGEIDTVRVLICEDAGGVVCSDVGLSFACELGVFDTRPTAVLAAGSYFTVWEAVDSTGVVLQETLVDPLDVTSLTHAILAPPDFDGVTPTEVLADIAFETDLDTDSFQSCSDLGILSGQFEYSLHDGPTADSPTIVAETVQTCGALSDNVSFSETDTFLFDDGEYTLYITAQETGTCTITWDGICTFSLVLGESNVVDCNIEVIAKSCS